MRVIELIESANEQKEIIKMGRRILDWHRSNATDIKSALKIQKPDIDDGVENLMKYAAIKQRNHIDQPINLIDIVGTDYSDPNIINWLKTGPKLMLSSKHVSESGRYDADTNTIIVFLNMHSLEFYIKTSNVIDTQSLYKESLTTLVHELQHAVDYEKTKGLISVSYKNRDGNSKVRATNEIDDIKNITDQILYSIDNNLIPQQGTTLGKIIDAGSLKSNMFKNLYATPEFNNIEVKEDAIDFDDIDFDDIDFNQLPKNTPNYKTPPLLSELNGYSQFLNGISDQDIKSYITSELQKYRYTQMRGKKGYAVKQNKRMEYLSRNVEINARVIQTVLALEEEFKLHNIKGLSKNPIRQKKQKEFIDYLILNQLKKNEIIEVLFPPNTRIKRWNRIKSRINKYYEDLFSNRSEWDPPKLRMQSDTDVGALFKRMFHGGR